MKMKRDMLIGGWHLCQHGHGLVKNSEQCPECLLEASLTLEQKELKTKAFAQNALKESNERLEELLQVFTERHPEQRSGTGEEPLLRRNEGSEGTAPGVVPGTTGDQEMTTLRTAANQAAKALEDIRGSAGAPIMVPDAEGHSYCVKLANAALSALRAAGVSGEEPKQ